MNNLIISKLNDKYYNKYRNLFNYDENKFKLINTTLLFNATVTDNHTICKYSFSKYNYHDIYGNILYDSTKYIGYINKFFNTNYDIYIINKYINNNKTFLLITNTYTQLKHYTFINKKLNCDILLYYNSHFNTFIQNNFKNPNINYNLFNTFYSSTNLEIYKQFLINLKNNTEDTNINIPNNKYSLIVKPNDVFIGLSLTASYYTNLKINYLISTILISLKLLEKNGTLLLFWSIVNINIPVIKKILSILTYGFKTVEIIDNDINQNLLIGVPEYYIKCSGYKDNISNDLIHKLIDIVINSIKYIDESCNVLDYYEDYTEKNPNHSLYYNKIDENEEYNKLSKKSRKTQKSSKTIEKEKETEKKEITPIYYIEDINIPELDDIMKESQLQFKVSTLEHKLEGIFIGYFEMVNNYILNAIDTDSKGNMIVKSQAIKQKDITNLTKLITMFEYNKLPYNKHALSVLLEKKDEYTDYIYGLTNTIDNTLVKYKDPSTIKLNTSALEHFTLTKPFTMDIYDNYIDKVSISNKVKMKLLEDNNDNKANNYCNTCKDSKDRKEIEFEEFEKENDILDKLTKGLSTYIKLDVTPDKIPITVKDFLSLASTIKMNLGINEFAISNTNEYKVGFIVRENNRILYDHDEKVKHNKNVLVHDLLSKELKKLNIPFKTTRFDNASFEEQAEFLKDVKVLIACHGTAFTNLFLLPKHASIMEVSFRKYWYCDPVCECHYTGECAYKTDCQNRNKVINKYNFDEKKGKLIYNKADYYNLSQLFGIGYKEILIEDANGYFNDTTNNTNELNNPLNLTNIYIDTNAMITKIRKLF